MRLGAYAGLNKDCSQGPLPEIKVTQNPTHGVFVIRKGKASTRRDGQCPAGTEAEVQVVFYQSRANYIGDDCVTMRSAPATKSARTPSALDQGKCAATQAP